MNGSRILNIMALASCMTAASSVWAQTELLTEEQAFENFKKAAASLRDGYTEVSPMETRTHQSQAPLKEVREVSVQPPLDSYVTQNMQTVSVPDNNVRLTGAPVRLEQSAILLDVENQTLQETFDSVMTQVSTGSGNWQTKWRLGKENSYLLNERINLTAETNFQNFVEYLVDRVNNMTGIQLFVTVFDSSRIIVISDTYY